MNDQLLYNKLFETINNTAKKYIGQVSNKLTLMHLTFDVVYNISPIVYEEFSDSVIKYPIINDKYISEIQYSFIEIPFNNILIQFSRSEKSSFNKFSSKAEQIKIDVFSPEEAYPIQFREYKEKLNNDGHE